MDERWDATAPAIKCVIVAQAVPAME